MARLPARVSEAIASVAAALNRASRPLDERWLKPAFEDRDVSRVWEAWERTRQNLEAMSRRPRPSSSEDARSLCEAQIGAVRPLSSLVEQLLRELSVDRALPDGKPRRRGPSVMIGPL